MWRKLTAKYRENLEHLAVIHFITAAAVIDHSVIPAAVKTPGNKFAGIIMPRINMVAVKTPVKKFA